LIEEGYATFSPDAPFAACDRWIEGWNVLESVVVNGARSAGQFERKYRLKKGFRDWLGHFEQALGFAGDRRSEYHDRRVTFCRAVRERFPEEDCALILWFHAAEADSLMKLGREDEADRALTSAIERFPDEACGYIGWADRHVYRSRTGRPEFKKAEAILKDALARRTLRDGALVLFRLVEVYRMWGEARPAQESPDGAQAETDRLLSELGLTRVELDEPWEVFAISEDLLKASAPLTTSAPRRAPRANRKLARWLRNGKGAGRRSHSNGQGTR